MISAVATGAYPIEYPHLKGKPHWRRTFAVYAALDTASTDITTYDRLIELVEQVTGKKCSRKLIRKWKEERHKLLSQQSALKKAGGRRQRAGGEQWEEDSDLSPLHFFLKEEACTELGGRDGENLLPPAPCPLSSKAEALVISEQLPENNPSIQNPKSKIQNPTTVISQQLPENSQPIQNPKSKIQNQKVQNHQGWLKQLATVGAIATAIVGLSWVLTPEDKYKPLANAEAPLVTTTLPTKKPQALEPKGIKIELSLTSPQDLKVKPGDKIKQGQILSDRTTERQRLQNQRRQLELSLKQLEIAIPTISVAKSIPVLRKLPPVSYQQELANISLKQQELTEAQTAIANQQEKIKQIQELLYKPELSQDLLENSEQSSVISQQLPENSLPIQNPKSKIQNQEVQNPTAIIIEHEQAILKQLQDSEEKARLQLTIAQSQLTAAKEKRQQDEYQLSLEENRRAIALQNQQLELERQRTIRAGQLQEREYSKAQIMAKIQEIDNALSQLSTVKAPYPGTIKKVKWTGQSDHTLTVELTLAVTSPEPTANSQH